MNKISKLLLSIILLSGLILPNELKAEENMSTISNFTANLSNDLTSISISFKAETTINKGTLSIKYIGGKTEKTLDNTNFKVIPNTGVCNKDTYENINNNADNINIITNGSTYCYYEETPDAIEGGKRATIDVNSLNLILTPSEKNSSGFYEAGTILEYSFLNTENPAEVAHFDYRKRAQLLNYIKNTYNGYIKIAEQNGYRLGLYIDTSKSEELIITDTSNYTKLTDIYELTGYSSGIHKNFEDLKNNIDYSIQHPSIDTGTNKIVPNEILKIYNTLGSKELIVYGSNIDWYLDATKLADFESDINFDVIIGSETNKTKIEKLLTNPSDALILEFMHSGALPEGTKINWLDVSDKFKDGDVLILYYFNEDTGTLEEKANNIKVENGYVTFPIEHCSEYILYKVGNNAQTSSLNVVLYILMALGSLAGVIFICTRKKLK